MAYRMRALHQTNAVLQSGAGIVFAVVAALVGPGTWVSAFVAAPLALLFTYLVLRAEARDGRSPEPPPPGAQLASVGETVRRAALVDVAVIAGSGAILAAALALGDVGWIVPAILLGNGAGQAILARRVAAAEARDPHTIHATRTLWGRRDLLLWPAG
jgi:hypothetical protein